MSDIDIITVRWDAERDVYKVNRPNWSGGEVVLWSAVKTMLASQAAEVARLTAERDGPRNRCPQCDQLRLELGEARHRLAALPADWRKDSSLETWFPITAMQMESLQAERDALLARVEAAEAGGPSDGPIMALATAIEWLEST